MSGNFHPQAAEHQQQQNAGQDRVRRVNDQSVYLFRSNRSEDAPIRQHCISIWAPAPLSDTSQQYPGFVAHSQPAHGSHPYTGGAQRPERLPPLQRIPFPECGFQFVDSQQQQAYSRFSFGRTEVPVTGLRSFGSVAPNTGLQHEGGVAPTTPLIQPIQSCTDHSSVSPLLLQPAILGGATLGDATSPGSPSVRAPLVGRPDHAKRSQPISSDLDPNDLGASPGARLGDRSHALLVEAIRNLVASRPTLHFQKRRNFNDRSVPHQNPETPRNGLREPRSSPLTDDSKISVGLGTGSPMQTSPTPASHAPSSSDALPPTTTRNPLVFTTPDGQRYVMSAESSPLSSPPPSSRGNSPDHTLTQLAAAAGDTTEEAGAWEKRLRPRTNAARRADTDAPLPPPNEEEPEEDETSDQRRPLFADAKAWLATFDPNQEDGP